MPPSAPGPRAGDWFRVERLLSEAGASDADGRDCAERIGRYYSERQKWGKAVKYYAQARMRTV